MNVIELAGCVLRNESNEILLLHRNKGRVQWELPGGKVEPGEDPVDTAIREIQEELGVKVAIGAHLGHASFMQDDKEWLYRWYEATIVDLSSAPIIREPQTFDDLAYHHPDALKDRGDLSANLKNLLDSGILDFQEVPTPTLLDDEPLSA